ncbi:hypothetical protein SY88_04205 [Clostridiales bacterium PH28_bin88]|nr:hypothetical protein SY88_04205 [Clostridiales bacterium PH28_bin88]
MGIWEQNLAALAARNPLVTEALQKYLAEPTSGPEGGVKRIFPCETRTGLPNLKLVQGDKHVLLHSNYDPYFEAGRWLESLTEQEPGGTLIVFGVGMFYHLEILLNQFPDKLIIGYEPDLEIFLHLLRNRDISRYILQHRLTLLVEHESVKWDRLLLTYLVDHPDAGIGWQAFPVYERVYSTKWRQLGQSMVALLIAFQSNLVTTRYFSNLWLINFFHNLLPAVSSPGAHTLFNRFKGIPAVIVSAGPSLNKNVHLLRELENRALILSAGSAINILEKHGVTPHCIVGIDGAVDDNSKIYERSLSAEDVFLLYSTTFYHGIVNNFRGPKVVMQLDHYDYLAWLNGELHRNIGIVRSGPSVSNVAMDLAYKLGCDPIVLLGQDLAYTNYQHYGDGAIFQQTFTEEDKQKKGAVVRKDIYGNDVLTTKAFLTMKTKFELDLQELKGRFFIDATEGGLKIEGTNLLTFRETIDNYFKMEFPLRRMLCEICRESSDDEPVGLSRVKAVLYQSKKAIRKIRQLCRRGLTTAERMRRHCQDQTLGIERFNEMADLLERWEHDILRHPLYTQLVLRSVNSEMYATTMTTDREVQNEFDLFKRGLAAARGYNQQFGIIYAKCALIEQLIDETLGKMEP